MDTAVSTLLNQVLVLTATLLSLLGVSGTGPIIQAPSEPVPEVRVEVPPAPSIPKPLPSNPVPTTKPPSSSPANDTGEELVKKSVVNIICSSVHDNVIELSTGSGVTITDTGIIITNAHVGQYFLLDDQSQKHFDCTIRKGGIATAAYKAELLFISPLWVKSNPNTLTGLSTGTGENDFALLRVTRSISPFTSLPDSYPHLPPDVSGKSLDKGSAVIFGGYPAHQGFRLETTLSLITESVKITNNYTFGDNTPELISSRAGAVAHQGSSGGAAASPDGKLIGLIATTGATSGGKTEINAITMNHVSKSLAKSIGESLLAYISGDHKNKSKNFMKSDGAALRTLLYSSI